MKKEFKCISTREESNVLILTYQCVDNPLFIETVSISDEITVNAIKYDPSIAERVVFDVVTVMLVDKFNGAIKPDIVLCISIDTEDGTQWAQGWSPEERIQAKFFGEPVRH